MQHLIEKAYEIAAVAHRGQKDKAGMDYMHHLLFVANLVDGEYEKATALLHDVIEDSEMIVEDLIEIGIPDVVVRAVYALTKKDRQDYLEYLSQVKSNPIARRVKLADLKHNSDLTRISCPVEADYARLKKYKNAINYLNAVS